jgi:signal-transduction protein with cAMP-binding, CBS, and nucleotidyltransferase domain
MDKLISVMDNKTILQFLKGIELFSNLNIKELQDVAKNVSEKHCSDGEMLFHENDPRENIFIIYEGDV